MSQRLHELRRKRAELELEITVPIKTRSTQLADPIECYGVPMNFKSFTHTFYRGLVCVRVPQVLGYECAKCGKRDLLDDAAQELMRMDEMISQVLHSPDADNAEAVQVLGSQIVTELQRFAAK